MSGLIWVQPVMKRIIIISRQQQISSESVLALRERKTSFGSYNLNMHSEITSKIVSGQIAL